MARMLDCGSSGLDSSPGCGHCIMFLGVTLDSHSASLNLNWPILMSIEILGSICVLCVASICETGFKPGFEEWLSKMCYRICSNGQFLRQHMKYKTIFFNKWPSTGRLDAHLAKSLMWKKKSSTTELTDKCVDFLDEQVFLIESHRKKMLKVKIADLEADLEVFQIKPYFCTVNWKDQSYFVFQSHYACCKNAVTIPAAESNL